MTQRETVGLARGERPAETGLDANPVLKQPSLSDSGIDENLARRELSVAERAEQTARRKELYEALHPDTKSTSLGGPGRAKDTRRQFGDELPDRFTKATAEATGQSERTVQRDVHRGEKLAEVIPRIKGTCLDSSGEMDALIRLPPDRREEIVKQAESGAKVSAKPVATVTPIRPIIPHDLHVALSAYDALSAQSKIEFHQRRPAPPLASSHIARGIPHDQA